MMEVFIQEFVEIHSTKILSVYTGPHKNNITGEQQYSVIVINDYSTNLFLNNDTAKLIKTRSKCRLMYN